MSLVPPFTVPVSRNFCATRYYENISPLTALLGKGIGYAWWLWTPTYIEFTLLTKLRGLSPHANYTDRAAAAGRRS